MIKSQTRNYREILFLLFRFTVINSSLLRELEVTSGLERELPGETGERGGGLTWQEDGAAEEERAVEGAVEGAGEGAGLGR